MQVVVTMGIISKVFVLELPRVYKLDVEKVADSYFLAIINLNN
jgi:hypothetical protein